MRQYKDALDALRFTEEEQDMLIQRLNQAAQTAPTPRKRRHPRRIILIAAAAACVLAFTAAAGAVVGFFADPESGRTQLAKFFQMSDSDVETDTGFVASGASDTAHGVTISLDGIYADDQTVYAIFSAVKDDGTPFVDIQEHPNTDFLTFKDYDVRTDGEWSFGSGSPSAATDLTQFFFQIEMDMSNIDRWQGKTVRFTFSDIISYMNGYKDPRRAVMFTQGTWNKKTDYYGMRIGTDPTNKSAMVSTYSNQIVDSKSPYLWMNAAEVTFLRAEGALRGWAMQGDAKDLYEKAVKLSFEERGATGVDTYLADALSTPLRYIDPMDNYSTQSPASTITIPWEAGDTDAVKERNLERIITQKWIAIFPLGIEAWSEYRRTGYPKLLPAVENKSAGTVNIKYGARRIPYPSEEYTENPVHLQEAISMLNGRDNAGTRVWWDVKPLE